MTVVGLCGGSGTGKGAVSVFLNELGFPVIDTDSVYHELISTVSDCSKEIIETFGDNILCANGLIDRKKLAQTVFADTTKELHKKLNLISHKHILREVRKKICENTNMGFDFTVVDAPMLYESGFNEECDFIVAILADKQLRVERITKRDGISKENAVLRINNQKSDDFLLKNADFVIENNGSLEELKKKTLSAVQTIKNNFKGEI